MNARSRAEIQLRVASHLAWVSTQTRREIDALRSALAATRAAVEQRDTTIASLCDEIAETQAACRAWRLRYDRLRKRQVVKLDHAPGEYDDWL